MPVAARLLGDVVHLVAFVGAGRGRDQRHRQAGFLGEALHPRPLVVVAQVVGDHLEDAVIEALHRQAQRQHLVGAGEGARHVHALLVLVQQGARGGEAERAGGDAFAHQRRHLGDLVGVAARSRCCSARPAHRRAPAPCGTCAADVDRARLGFQRVEVFGEASPTASRCLRQARRRECPRRLPSARSGTVRDRGAPARSRRRNCP